MENRSTHAIVKENLQGIKGEVCSSLAKRVLKRTEMRHFLLGAIVLGTFFANMVWMLLDTLPPSWDQGLHLHLAFKYWSVLTSGSDRWWVDLLNVEPFYPPLFHLSLVPVMGWLGFSTDHAVLVNSFYLSVIILSAYGIGARLYGWPIGLLTAFLVASYPFLAYNSRQCLIGPMLTAMVSLSYYLFLRCDHFQDRKFSLLFALSFAFGLMVKWTYFFYMIPAIFAILFPMNGISISLRMKQTVYYLGLITALMILPFLIFVLGEWKWTALVLEGILVFALVRYAVPSGLPPAKIINLLTLTLVSVLICFPWYAHNLVKMAKGVGKFGFPDSVLKGGMEWSLPVWGFYLEAAGRQMGMPLLILFLIALAAFLFRKIRVHGILLAWIVIPYIVFTFINNKGVRYTMPCLPAMAVISALVIVSIKRDSLRKAAVGIVIGFGLFTYVYTGFLPGDARFPGLGGPAFGFKMLPKRENWPINQILDDMVEAEEPSSEKWVTARTLTNHPFFHRGAFRDYAEIRGLPVAMKSVKRNLGEMTDFFITKDRDEEGESGAERISTFRKRLLGDPALTRTFSIFKTYPLPNGANGLLIQKKVTPATDIPEVRDLKEVGRRFLQALAEYPIYGIKNAVNPVVTIVPTRDPRDLYLGRYRKIFLTADSVESNRVPLDKVELTLENVQINLFDLFLNGKLIFLEIGRIFPRMTIRFAPLEALANKAMRGKGEARLEGEGDRIKLWAGYRVKNWSVEGALLARVIFEPGKRIRPVVEKLVIGPLDIPEIFYRRIVDEEIRLDPTPGWPMVTDIRSFRIHPRKLEINPIPDQS